MSGTLAVEPKILNGLVYRQLPYDQWHRLKPIFKANNWFLPPRELATAMVAENQNDEIVGVQMFQLVLHAEPVWVKDKNVQPKAMWNMFKDKPVESSLVLPGFVLVAPDKRTEILAEDAGFTEIAGKLYRCEFQKKV